MAIILPNTRNALGVPNRYNDLASAGLRWTPSQPETGTLVVNITGDANGRWSIDSGATWYASGDSLTLPIGTYPVSFLEVDGYVTPDGVSATVPANDTLTVSASYEAATGYSAYLLVEAGPVLISAAAYPTKCVGGDNTLFIVNGGMFLLGLRIGADSDWAACSGGRFLGSTWGYGIKTDGTLHAIDAANNVSQIGVATNWAAVSGRSDTGGNNTYTAYARNTTGELYALQGATAAKIGASTTWETVSGCSRLYSTTIKNAAIAIDDGKLIRLDADTPTQIGVATNWAAVGPVLDGVCLAKNDLGELFVVTATLETTAVVQVGVSTNWDKLSYIHATNTTGELYSINTTTTAVVQVGVSTNWSALAGARWDEKIGTLEISALNAQGELYSVVGTTATRVGAASDWMKLEGSAIAVAVRGTPSSSSGGESSSGLLFATGGNSAGQLGLGDSGEGTNRSAFSLVGDRVWSAIDAGYDFSIGVSNGELYAWGENGSGQLGLGDTDPRSVPTKVGSATNWVSIAAGKYYALAVNDVGELYAWGENGSSYRLGLGDTDNRSVPTRAGSATNWLAVAAGDSHSLAVNTAGEIYAWGSNQWGKTGMGTSEGTITTPTKIGSATNWLAVAAGAYVSFAVNADGELYSWGYNSSGILGIGSDEGVEYTTPTRVGSATNWASVATTGLGKQAFAITLGGALYAWGYNSSGQLGLGDTTNRNAPVQVGSAENWVSISTGDTHSAAVNSSGELYTWGNYTSGQLGQGSGGITIPTRVGTGTGWQRVAAGQTHTLATMALTGDNGLLSASGVMDSYGEVYPYASATWSIDGGTTWNAGGGAIQLPAGTYTITWGGADEFTLAPASSSVTITAGQASVVQGTYTSSW